MMKNCCGNSAPNNDNILALLHLILPLRKKNIFSIRVEIAIAMPIAITIAMQIAIAIINKQEGKQYQQISKIVMIAEC